MDGARGETSPGARARLALIALGVVLGAAVVTLVAAATRADEWAVFVDPANPDARVAYVQPDADLGYAPLPDRTVRARRVLDGHVVYDVLYTIDADGLRITPSDP